MMRYLASPPPLWGRCPEGAEGGERAIEPSPLTAPPSGAARHLPHVEPEARLRRDGGGKRKRRTTALLAAICLLATPTAHAQPAGEFYKDRQVSLVVGFNPGGGFDTYARAVARHMGRHIAGAPNIVVRNMPGAGSVIAANYLANAAPKDGSEFALLSDTVATDALLGVVRVQYDANKLTWLGSASKSLSVCVVWHTSPVRTAKDLAERELVVGAAGTTTVAYAMALKNILGLRLRIVSGYAGTSGLMLALERGEIEAMCGQIYDAIKTQRPEWLAKGLIRPAIQLGLEKAPELGDAPWAMEMAGSDEDRKVLGLIVGSTIMGRPFVAPPGIPDDRRNALRKAFAATMTDPQFLADAEKARLDINPISGEAIERYVADSYATPKPVIARAREILTAK